MASNFSSKFFPLNVDWYSPHSLQIIFKSILLVII
jgi:hypothetical protein